MKQHLHISIRVDWQRYLPRQTMESGCHKVSTRLHQMNEDDLPNLPLVLFFPLRINMNYFFVSVRHSAEMVFSAYQKHHKTVCEWDNTHMPHRPINGASVVFPVIQFSWHTTSGFHLNHTQPWLLLFWFGVCSVRVGDSSLSSSTGGRWCSWGSLINSSRAFISSLMDLVSAYQGFDYLLLAMGRVWLHMCVCVGYVFVRNWLSACRFCTLHVCAWM